MAIYRTLLKALICVLVFNTAILAGKGEQNNPFVIKLEIPPLADIDACIFEPLTGKFVERFKEKADRLYVADVTGDWREEIIVLAGNELHIYANTAPNPRPNEKRLWSDRNYRRLKQCYNYYSP
jgi:hypothetical protein